MFHDAQKLNPEALARLLSLEDFLRPRELIDKVRSVVLPEAVIYVGLDSALDGTNEVEKAMTQTLATAHELGMALAGDTETLTTLLPEITKATSYQLWSFGRGLAQGSDDPLAIWSRLVDCFFATPANDRKSQLLRAFINGIAATSRELANSLLDEALSNELLASYYPTLQIAAGIDETGVDRLIASLGLGKAPIGSYGDLAGGSVTNDLAGCQFNRLILRIADKPDGLDIALDILYMRLQSKEGLSNSSSSEIIDVGCNLMRKLRFTESQRTRRDYRFQLIVKSCLVGENGAGTVREMCGELRRAAQNSQTVAVYHSELLRFLVNAQPFAVVEGLCGDTPEELAVGLKILELTDGLENNPFDTIPVQELTVWCDQRPEIRYPIAASGVTVTNSRAGRPEWTERGRILLDRAPDRVAVLRRMLARFGPRGWTGSYTEVLESNAAILDELSDHPDQAVREFIADYKLRLAEAIKAEKDAETIGAMAQRQRYESFE